MENYLHVGAGQSRERSASAWSISVRLKANAKMDEEIEYRTGLEMILDILTVLFFVLGFLLILWMIGQRHRDVLYGPYVIKSRRPRRVVLDGRRKDVPANEAGGLAALRALVPLQKSWAKPQSADAGRADLTVSPATQGTTADQ